MKALFGHVVYDLAPEGGSTRRWLPEKDGTGVLRIRVNFTL